VGRRGALCHHRGIDCRSRGGRRCHHHTLDEAEEAYNAYHRAHNHSPNTIEHYRWTLTDYRHFLAASGHAATVGMLTAPVMQEFHAWLTATPLRKPGKTGLARSLRSTQGRMKDMRAFVRFLEEIEWLDRAPKVAIPKTPQTLFPIFNDDELKRLFACPHLVGTGEQATRNRAMLAVFLDAGIRLGEMVALLPNDLLLDDGLIRVTGKGSKTRLSPISPTVVRYIREWLATRGDGEGNLFWLTRSGVRMLFRRIQAETGLYLTPHKLRHTAATKLVRSGMDLHSVKRILGHQDLKTVEVYLSLTADDLREKHNAVSPFDSIAVNEVQPVKRRRLKS